MWLMKTGICPISGSPATLLAQPKIAAIERFDSPKAGGVYDITLQAKQILTMDIITADIKEAITTWLKTQRSDNDNPPLLTRAAIREATGQPLL